MLHFPSADHNVSNNARIMIHFYYFIPVINLNFYLNGSLLEIFKATFYYSQMFLEIIGVFKVAIIYS